MIFSDGQYSGTIDIELENSYTAEDTINKDVDVTFTSEEGEIEAINDSYPAYQGLTLEQLRLRLEYIHAYKRLFDGKGEYFSNNGNLVIFLRHGEKKTLNVPIANVGDTSDVKVSVQISSHSIEHEASKAPSSANVDLTSKIAGDATSKSFIDPVRQCPVVVSLGTTTFNENSNIEYTVEMDTETKPAMAIVTYKDGDDNYIFGEGIAAGDGISIESSERSVFDKIFTVKEHTFTVPSDYTSNVATTLQQPNGQNISAENIVKILASQQIVATVDQSDSDKVILQTEVKAEDVLRCPYVESSTSLSNIDGYNMYEVKHDGMTDIIRLQNTTSPKEKTKYVFYNDTTGDMGVYEKVVRHILLPRTLRRACG